MKEQKPIDVLVVAVTDYANSGANYARALRKLGLNVVTLKGDAHPFLYPEQMTIDDDIRAHFALDRVAIAIDSPRLRQIYDGSRVIVFKGSYLVDAGIDLTGKPIIVHHGGTIYRENAKVFNDMWNNIASHTVLQCPDLMGLGAKNESLIIFPVDTDFLKPEQEYFAPHKHVIFGHFPSVRASKGSDAIDEVVARLAGVNDIAKRWEYVSSGDTGIWFDHIAMKKRCDVYIEGLQPEIDGKAYGAWGNSAIEAAALGKIVITHSRFDDIYRREYGDHPFLIANTKQELFDQMMTLICQSSDARWEIQRKTREWVVRTHSFDATALRMWEKIYRHYFPEKDIRNEFTRRISHKQTICQTLREVYDMVDDTEAKVKLESAMVMAKKMNQRLYDYRSDWDKGMFDVKEA